MPQFVLPLRRSILQLFLLGYAMCACLGWLIQPASAAELAGQWDGRMEPGNLSAQLELTLCREASGWTGTLEFHAGPDASTLSVTALQVSAEDVAFTASLEGAAMAFALKLDDRLLLGTVNVTEGERVLAAGPVGLAAHADPAAAARLTAWLDAQGSPIDAAGRRAVIDKVCTLFKANYVQQDTAEAAAADLLQRASQGEFDSINTAARLAEAISTRLAETTGDKHVHLKFSSERVPDPLAGTDSAETPAELEQLRINAAAEGFGIGEPQFLGDNIGYLQVTRFTRADLAGDALAAAMTRLAPARALVIDLRNCHGGDPELAVLLASWLFSPPARHWNDMLRRFDNSSRQYWTAAWLPGPRFVDKPVYVLTAQRTFSAPESLAYELQQTERATVVGETTGGGAHPGVWFPVDDHFALFIPLSRYVSAVTGGDWEGTGVVPDVPCPAERALEAAAQLARAELD